MTASKIQAAFRHARAWGRRHPMKARIVIVGLASIVFTLLANGYFLLGSNDRIYASIDDIPANEVALVLGARANTYYFWNRIEAAAELYKAGRVSHILVSGDNHVQGYDEPTDMKDALIQRGIPEAAITCDFAGFRTLDSVYRSRSVFGLRRVTIVSQEFHNRRAIAIARRHGIDAIGYSAEDVPAAYAARTMLREILARNLAVLDLYLFNRKPKFPGPPEFIQLG